MSIRLGQTNIELAGTAAEIARMGIHGEEAIINLTETLGKLSRTSDIVSEGAKQDFAKLVGITDTAADSVENLASVITMLGQETKAGEAAIVEMARDIAASTKLYNVAATDAAAFASVARDLGLRVRGTGRAFNRTFRRINEFSMAAKAGTAGGLALQRVMGMTSEAIQNLIKTDPSQAFTKLLEGLNRVASEEGSLSSTLEDLDLSTERTRQVLELLAKKHEDVADRINRSRGEFAAPIALMKEWARQTETFAFKWSQMTQKLRVAAQQWGKDLIPVLEHLIVLLNALFTLVRNIPKPLRTLMQAFTALLVVVGPVLLIVGKLKLAMASLAGQAATTGAAFMASLGNFALWTLAIGTLTEGVRGLAHELGMLFGDRGLNPHVAYMQKYWEGMRKGVDRFNRDMEDPAKKLKHLQNIMNLGLRDTTKEIEALRSEIRALSIEIFASKFAEVYEKTNTELRMTLENLQAETDAERELLALSRARMELKEKIAELAPEGFFGDLNTLTLLDMADKLKEGLPTDEFNKLFLMIDRFYDIWELRQEQFAKGIVESIRQANIRQTLEDTFGSAASSVYSQLKDLFEQWKELRTLFEGNVPKQFVGVFNKAFKRITGQLTNAMEKTSEKVYPTALQKGTVEEFRARMTSRPDDIPKQQLKEQKEANVILGRVLTALNADQIPGFTLR